MVDVVAGANSNTLPLKPTVTGANIFLSQGSTITPSADGKTYSFASTTPPILTSSYPTVGQLNVATNQPTLKITFGVPVWTLDGVINLYDQTAGTGPVVLNATNGAYAGGTLANLVNTLNFNLPTMIADHVYYVTIAPGNRTTNTGITDQDFNLFPGFTYNGTLYFKTANPLAPKLLSTPLAASNPSVTNVSLTGAVINGTFDQNGNAFYLVLNSGSAAPTLSQINGTTAYAGSIKQGTFAINQTNPITQFGVFSKPLVPSTTYDVWLSAESSSELNGVKTPIPNASYFGSATKLVKSGTVTSLVTPTAS